MLLRHCTNSRSGNLRRGFSLVEVLIAIGILGVGLGMVMLIFPAAVMENRSSTNNVIGTIMCENALAIAKTRLTSGYSGISSSMTAFPPSDETPAVIHPSDLQYAMGYDDDDTSRRRVQMFGKQIGGSNDYLLVAVAYQDGGGNITIGEFAGTCSTNDDGDYLLSINRWIDGSATVRIGSTIIADNGRSSTVVSAEGGLKVKDDLSVGDTPLNFFVIAEDGKALQVMNIIATRTPLKE